MPNELKNANVIFISLVKAGANRRETIFKVSADVPAFTRDFVVRKADDARQVIYGVVYPAGDPSTPDTQGDFAKADEVERMAYRFMREGRTASGVDRDHTFQTLKGVYVAESWLVRKGDPIFGAAEDVGAWAAGIRIEDAALYAELKAAGYRGFSIAGVADRAEVGKGDQPGGWLRTLRKLLGQEEDVDAKELKDLQKGVEDLATLVKKLDERMKKIEGDGDGGETPDDAQTPDLTKQLAKVTALITTLDERVKKVEGDGTKPGDTQTPDLTKQLSDVSKSVEALLARVEKVEKHSPGSAQPDPVKKDGGKPPVGLM